jgi:hypothetical protein
LGRSLQVVFGDDKSITSTVSRGSAALLPVAINSFVNPKKMNKTFIAETVIKQIYG